MGAILYLNWGPGVHVGSIFWKVLQGEASLRCITELVQILPDPKTHIHLAVWIRHDARTKPVVEVVQTLRGESFAICHLLQIDFKKKSLP